MSFVSFNCISLLYFFLFENQSLSDEDSFKKISLQKEVLEKIQELLMSLVDRLEVKVETQSERVTENIICLLLQNKDAERWQAASNFPAHYS